MEIKSNLRFDDRLRRDRSDPLAPIRQVFETFNAFLRQPFEPSANLTVDKQLVEFHGRVRFRQYIASKPGKFGIKIFWLCCADTFYALNGAIYIGVGSIYPGQSVTSLDVTMHLMKPYLNSGRNLTADNWFSSGELVEKLKENKTFFVCTVRQDSRSVAAVAKSTAARIKKDTRVFYNDQGTALVSFWDKKNKPVLLLDSFHRVVPISQPQRSHHQ